jgi:hypothetical protein
MEFIDKLRCPVTENLLSLIAREAFAFSRDIDFFRWRSTNEYFLDVFVHP